jgi:putative phosphoesterase
MKIGLLGDIHGNDIALEAVLTSACQLGVERLLITGDLVGYYFAPNRVMELLEPWNKAMVRGNHEEMLSSIMKDPSRLPKLETKYGSGLRMALEQLSPDQLSGLTGLPATLNVEIDSTRFLLCHGSPWDVDQYIYPDAPGDVLGRCASLEIDMVVMGHTHYPMVRKVGATLLVNPGSTGQPRNRQPGAHWGVYDTSTHEVSLRCETYDHLHLVEEARRRHPDIPYLAGVLERT